MDKLFYGRRVSELSKINEKEQKINNELRSYTKHTSEDLDDIIYKHFARERKKAENICIGLHEEITGQFVLITNGKMPKNIEEFKERISDLEIYDDKGKTYSNEEFWQLVNSTSIKQETLNPFRFKIIDEHIFSNS